MIMQISIAVTDFFLWPVLDPEDEDRSLGSEELFNKTFRLTQFPASRNCCLSVEI